MAAELEVRVALGDIGGIPVLLVLVLGAGAAVGAGAAAPRLRRPPSADHSHLRGHQGACDCLSPLQLPPSAAPTKRKTTLFVAPLGQCV